MSHSDLIAIIVEYKLLFIAIGLFILVLYLASREGVPK